MKIGDIDDPFFRGKALLLVEDPLTRVTLTRCWSQDVRARKITVRAVGGHDSVKALVQAAREEGRGHVFGLVDRDFAAPSSNDDPVQRTARHEIENHLLDFDALAAVSALSAVELEAKAHERASALHAWMALRLTMLYVQQRSSKLPPTPTPAAVSSLEAASAWLRAAPISRGFAKDAQEFTPAYLNDDLLGHHYRTCRDDLASNGWVDHFSGKEILRHLRGTFELWRLPLKTDEDLARAVVERWLEAKTVPGFIEGLRDRILTVCGL
ncbi:MAG: hypothetical protein U0324_19870 [Polyangiales bacterium]